MKRLDTTVEAENIQIEIFRKMGAEGRLQAGIELARTAEKLLAEGVRMRHPDYTEHQVKLAVIKLRLGDALFAAAYPEAKDLIV